MSVAGQSIAVHLGEAGIPGGLIGYEYRPLSEPVYFEGVGEQGLVAIATSGLRGRFAIDVASGHVVRIPKIESATASHVNGNLDSFNRCVATGISLPFCADGDEEKCEYVAEELRDLVSGIDETTLVRNGFWETFSATTWRSGNVRTGPRDLGPVPRFGQPSKLKPVAALQPSTRSGRYWITLSRRLRFPYHGEWGRHPWNGSIGRRSRHRPRAESRRSRMGHSPGRSPHPRCRSVLPTDRSGAGQRGPPGAPPSASAC